MINEIPPVRLTTYKPSPEVGEGRIEGSGKWCIYLSCIYKKTLRVLSRRRTHIMPNTCIEATSQPNPVLHLFLLLSIFTHHTRQYLSMHLLFKNENGNINQCSDSRNNWVPLFLSSQPNIVVVVVVVVVIHSHMYHAQSINHCITSSILNQASSSIA
jgi:hypothetical protein